MIKTAVIRPHGGIHYRSKKQTAPNRYSIDQLRDLQSQPLDFKIDWTRGVINAALLRLEKPAIAFSAGKDSTVLLHFLLQYRPDIDVIYGNTTIEFPECVKFAHKIRDDWKLNFHEAIPDVSFWWVVKNYGWPLMGKSYGVGGVAHKKSRERFFRRLESEGKLTGQYAIQSQVPISSACCTFLKERPSIKIQKKIGVDGVFLGILASESRRRMFNFLEYGELYYPKSQKIWKCHPLAIWTDNDIWQYLWRYKVPYAEIYDSGFYDSDGEWICHKRNGCMFCGMDLKHKNNHLAIMRRTHPRAWRTVMIKMGLGRVLQDLHNAIYRQYDMFAEIMPMEDYLEMWPCAFDRI